MTAIFYAATEPTRDDHFLVRSTGQIVWVRMEIVETDPMTALAEAKPMEGETLLNSMDMSEVMKGIV